MNTIIKFTVLAIMMCNTVFADNTKTTKFKVEKATVFFRGAQLTCNQTFALAQGINEIIFQDVSPYLDQQSIQAGGKGTFIITDVQFRVKEAEIPKTQKVNAKYAKEIKQATDSLEEVNFVLEDLLNKQTELNTEKQILLNNRIIKGETKKDSLDLLKASMEYLRLKLNNINSELLKIKREQTKVNVLKVRLEERIQTLEDLRYQLGDQVNNGNQKAVYEIVVTVLAETAAQANIYVSYYDAHAGWSPSYDLRAENNSANIQLQQKANIYQTTGLDWKETKLKLSTSTPNKNTDKPFLNTQFLSYYDPYQYQKRRAEKEALKKAEHNAKAKASIDADKLYQMPAAANSYSGATISNTEQVLEEEVNATYSSQYTDVAETMVNVEYDVKLPYSIQNDGKLHTVIIQSKELPTKFIYSMVPKLDKHVYLFAQVSDWESLNLVPGNSRIYFDGSYVGQAYLNMDESEDTLEINLGYDESWIVKRVQKKDKTKEKVLAEEKIKTVTYEITIRNTKEFSSMVNVEDQIPVSQQKEIQINLIEDSKASVDEASGKLTWKLNMKPKETKKLTVTYEVHYPSDKTLANL